MTIALRMNKKNIMADKLDIIISPFHQLRGAPSGAPRKLTSLLLFFVVFELFGLYLTLESVFALLYDRFKRRV